VGQVNLPITYYSFSHIQESAQGSTSASESITQPTAAAEFVGQVNIPMKYYSFSHIQELAQGSASVPVQLSTKRKRKCAVTNSSDDESHPFGLAGNAAVVCFVAFNSGILISLYRFLAYSDKYSLV